ncbi:MAG: hypothetical protein V8T22_07420 [Oscillospiraceae bacterium]
MSSVTFENLNETVFLTIDNAGDEYVRVITQKSSGTTQSMLVKATKDWSEDLKKFSIEPKGVFGSTATVKCGNDRFCT